MVLFVVVATILPKSSPSMVFNCIVLSTTLSKIVSPVPILVAPVIGTLKNTDQSVKSKFHGEGFNL
jgi:hypothetical protein